MTAPRLVIVCCYFVPSSTTGARRSTRLARFMAERGTEPVVVTAAPEFYGDAITTGPSTREDFEVVEVPYSGVYGALRRAGGPGRLAENGALTLAYGRAIRQALARRPRPDFLYFWGHPFWYFPWGRYFLMRYGVRYILDFPDVFYMKGITYRMGQRAGARNLVDKACEAWAVGGGSLVLHTTRAQTQLYRRRYPAKPARDFVTIRCGYDADELASVRRASRNPDDPFRIAIFGKFSAYSAQDADVLARAVGRLHARAPVQVIHMGEREAGLEAAFRSEGMSRCFSSLGMRPYREGLGVLAAADCLVLNAISDLSLPAKIYDYIGLNRPIMAFAPRESSVGRLLSRFPGAFVVQTPEQAAEALCRVAEGGLQCLDPELDPTEFSQQYQFEKLLGAMNAVMEQEGSGG